MRAIFLIDFHVIRWHLMSKKIYFIKKPVTCEILAQDAQGFLCSIQSELQIALKLHRLSLNFPFCPCRKVIQNSEI